MPVLLCGLLLLGTYGLISCSFIALVGKAE